jgi:hypothetical protein
LEFTPEQVPLPDRNGRTLKFVECCKENAAQSGKAAFTVSTWVRPKSQGKTPVPGAWPNSSHDHGESLPYSKAQIGEQDREPEFSA